MPETDQNPSALLAMLDQLTTQQENFAAVVGAYYKALVGNGIPERLAYALTLEWHRMVVPKIYGIGN